MEIYHRVSKEAERGNWMVHFPRFDTSRFYSGDRIILRTANDVMLLLFAYDEQQASRFYEYWRKKTIHDRA